MKSITLLAFALCAHAAPLVAAQAQPADAAASVPAAPYRSVFESYRPAAEEPIADWRALNEEVAKVGGHVGIMKGAGQSRGTPASPPKSPASAGHHH